MNSVSRVFLGVVYVGISATLERMAAMAEDQWLVSRKYHRGKEADGIEKAIDYLNRAARLFRVIGNRMETK